MKLQYDVSEADVVFAHSLSKKAFREAANRKFPFTRVLRWGITLSMLVAVIGADKLYEKYLRANIGADIYWVTLPALLYVLVAIAYVAENKASLEEFVTSELAPFPIHQQLATSPDGLLVESRFGRSLYPWSVIRMEMAQDYFVLHMPMASVLTIPHRAFATVEDRDKFDAEVRGYLTAR